MSGMATRESDIDIREILGRVAEIVAVKNWDVVDALYTNGARMWFFVSPQ